MRFIASQNLTIMKKLSYIMLFLILGMNLTAQSVWDGKREAIRNGLGTEENPYLIENAQNLAWLIYSINWDYSQWTDGKYFLLTTDIDLNGSPDNQWIPIGAGNSTSGTKNFNGVFDGGFHKITGLYIDTDNAISDRNSLWYGSNAAFFSSIQNNAVVKNLYLEGTINSDRMAAGFSGKYGNFEYCVSNIDIETSTQSTGGIVAQQSGTIRNCANLGDIKGRTSVGGIVGMKGNIENCYNMGRIEADNNVGGIEGVAMMSNVKNCYNVGEIVFGTDAGYVGAIVGRVASNSTVENSYYLDGCINESNEYGEPQTAEFMRSMEFVNLLNNETDVWVMDTDSINDGYPVFGNTPFDVEEIVTEFSDVVVVYPNPVTDNVYVVGNVASCEIYDLVGKRVKTVWTNMDKISVTDLQSGIYMMRFVMKNGNVVTKKIVKQ